MPDQDSKTPSMHIADAIRLKRDARSRKSSDEELEAMEAALLADIEAFDLDGAAKQVLQEEVHIQSQATGLVTDVELNYPNIVPEGVAPRKAALGQGGGVSPASLEGLVSGGLLGQLRQEAESRLDRLGAEQLQLSSVAARVDQALQQVFSYLHELVQQLDVLKPAIPRTYPVAGDLELSELVWQEGFADYRTRPQSAGALTESVSLSYRLEGGQPLVMERDGTVADTFRQNLFDLNLSVQVEEFRNERRYLERARFTVAPEVKVNVRWAADFQNGVIQVLARNLERLGSVRYTVAPELVNQALLDEFTRVVLGQPNQFARMLRR